MTSGSADAAFELARRAVLDVLGEKAWVPGGFWSPTVSPALDGMIALRLVFVYSAPRVAGLRSWRDGVELVVQTEAGAVHVVAHEAAKWARLALKGHGPSREIAGTGAIVGDLPCVVALARLLGAALPASFEAAEEWVLRSREAAANAERTKDSAQT